MFITDGPHTETVTIRRTFNIGGYETLAIEVSASGYTLEEANLQATNKVLQLAKIQLERVYENRIKNINNNPYDQIILELQSLNGA